MLSLFNKTDFAPAERVSWEVLSQQLESVRGYSALQVALARFEGAVMLLNDHSQIVFINDNCLQTLGITDPALVYGCRPGEVLDCAHAVTAINGCGTSDDCRNCGVIHAFFASQGGETMQKECSILILDSPEPLNLTVRTVPYNIGESHYVIVSMTQ